MNRLSLTRSAIATLVLLSTLQGSPAHATPADRTESPDAAYLDVLDLHGSPANATDRSFNMFFDAGAWQGYSLPPVHDAGSGFVGPFAHSLAGGQWIGKRFAQLALSDAGTGQPMALTPTSAHSGPGYLLREFTAPGVTVRQTLYFTDAWHAVVKVDITATTDRTLSLAVEGTVMKPADARIAVTGGEVVQTFGSAPSRLATRLQAQGQAGSSAAMHGDDYRVTLDHPLSLKAGVATSVFVEQEWRVDARAEMPPALDDGIAWQHNRERWAGYLKTLSSSHLDGVDDAMARRVAFKAIITLLGNWRAARGDLHHDGVVPSYSNPDFNGFWAWDSWKHAVALAHFAPQLAEDQMRAMFDFQAADGMVPDCVYLDKAENNWRDTKPPLATWATREIYRQSGDRAFVAEMYDKLVRYHRWWFKARDHDHNGLAEFGSTDGTRIAAAWESGMDNAVRFDHARMVKNGDGAWSLDQESVDLNAYLYREKLDLAALAEVLGKGDDHAMWLREAEAMKGAIQQRMYDRAAGYFFDVRLGSDERVRVYGSEGWMPLWAGVASAEQAAAVSRVMLDPRKFATYMPLPTLARDDTHFSPVKGYWRGPVWLDQAYFGVEALRRYGYGNEANTVARQLVLHAQGLTGQSPMYENYDPLTGHGYQSPNFSWAAASYLLLLQPGDAAP
ncbi:trehalase family glycosidase [Dyella sp. C9]|uniref:MGH1-like glycoside hydrolase domain-containing protein n=1 Tax=Dyella sp. C9 TaxID=2202154 RepID=UPI000DEF6FF1|nr:trehalase family glycosidase [Dyella sp. C9]